MLLEQAVFLADRYVVEWMTGTLKLNLTARHDKMAPNATMRSWLHAKGCPVFPKNKDRIIVSAASYFAVYKTTEYDHEKVAAIDSARGILIGIEEEDAFIKVLSTSDVILLHTSAIIKDPAFT